MPSRLTLREVAPEERQEIERLAHSRTDEARLVQRAQIVLGLLGGERPSAVARRLQVTRPTVYTWARRFDERGLPGLRDQPRPGRPPTYTADQRAEVIAAAL